MDEQKEIQQPSTELGYKVWFTSDNHIRHKNIIKHCPQRAEAGGFDPEDLEAQDKWLLDKWNATVGKKDLVYIVGDFTFMTTEWAKRYLGKMNGRKYLILGNHDKSTEHLQGYFKDITQMKEVQFKQKNFPFLDEDFRVFLCHYAMVVWPSKHYGVVQVHGHSHGRLDDFNNESTDLRVDVGWDSTLGNYGLVSLEDLYKYFKAKTGGLKMMEYATKMKNDRAMTV